MFHRSVQAILLKLMNVMLRLLEALSYEDAFALLVDLEHMKLGLFARPTKHLLENVRDIPHLVDRIIPTDDQIPRLQIRFGPSFLLSSRAGQ